MGDLVGVRFIIFKFLKPISMVCDFNLGFKGFFKGVGV